jgi:hypothetical protein
VEIPTSPPRRTANVPGDPRFTRIANVSAAPPSGGPAKRHLSSWAASGLSAITSRRLHEIRRSPSRFSKMGQEWAGAYQTRVPYGFYESDRTRKPVPRKQKKRPLEDPATGIAPPSAIRSALSFRI